MLDVAARISAFETLGRFIGQYKDESKDEDLKKLNTFFLENFRTVIQQAGIYNNWFTLPNVEFAMEQWSKALSRESLEEWVNRYPADHFENDGSKTVALIMAGNIPLVGFHDFLSVLMSGHKVLAKPSTDDDKLLPFLAQVLVAIERGFAERMEFATGQLKEFDAVIATGSNNSSRYFDYYFAKYPNVIRKNRSSVAVLTGDESEEELKKLGNDVFTYFGLGCRSISKLYLPEGFDKDRIFKAFFDFNDLINNNKYGNNFDYNRAIYLLEQQAFLENGFIILKENEALHAPAAVLYTESYQSMADLKKKLDDLEPELQCIASNSEDVKNSIPLGSTQMPALWDYADKVDTIRFLRTV